jgi:SAM-dependent methyltransferase
MAGIIRRENPKPSGMIKQASNRPIAVDISGNDFYPRYLAAKKAIDDRALNHHVQEALRNALEKVTGQVPLNILEIGAGIGTMLQRFLERGLLKGSATYVVTDSDPGQLAAARKYLSQWAQKSGHALTWSGRDRGRLRTPEADVTVMLIPVSAEELTERSDRLGSFDLLIAHAVLDLLDFHRLLPGLFSQLKANGLAYLTCNFDGKTVFLPECDADQKIIEGYHASMEARLTGANHTGRRVLQLLHRPGMELLAAGSSDWIIHPLKNGYAKDEIFFLHAIIATVEHELAKKECPPSDLAAWARLRHQQIEAGRLSFLAGHLDFLVRCQGLLP